MTSLHTVFCENLRAVRKSKGFTQADMAKVLKTSQAHYCVIELGRRTPHLETIQRVAEALGVEPYELLKPSSVVPAPKGRMRKKAAVKG